MLTPSQNKVIKAWKKNPNATQKVLAEKAGVSVNTVNTALKAYKTAPTEPAAPTEPQKTHELGNDFASLPLFTMIAGQTFQLIPHYE